MYSTASEYSILECPALVRPLMLDKTTTKWRYNNVEIAPNCPRCASSNTKFCYYNNYSLSQPRYFCKGCRRYWTKGGSLRNVPVGGGCRKSRRSRAAARHGGPDFSAAVTSPAVDESDGGACSAIDMAAVFAKYVDSGNNNNNNTEDDSFSPGDSNVSSDENAPGSSVNGSQMEDVNNGLAFDGSVWDSIHYGGIDQVLPQFCVQQEIDGQDLVFQNCCGGLDQLQPGVLGNGVSDAYMMWSDGSDLPNFGSQNDDRQEMVQVDQDFGLFSPDDQFRIAAGNLATDNWGSFDLSAYEAFSTP